MIMDYQCYIAKLKSDIQENKKDIKFDSVCICIFGIIYVILFCCVIIGRYNTDCSTLGYIFAIMFFYFYSAFFALFIIDLIKNIIKRKHLKNILSVIEKDGIIYGDSLE